MHKGRYLPRYAVLLFLTFCWIPCWGDTTWARWLGCPRAIVSQIYHARLNPIRLSQDPVSFYFKAHHSRPEKVNALHFDAFAEAAHQLIRFGTYYLPLLNRTDQRQEMASHIAVLKNGFRSGFLSYRQLMGSMREMAFLTAESEMPWDAHENVWATIEQIWRMNGVVLPIVQDEILSREELLRYRGAFIYVVQLPFTKKSADGELMMPWRFLHHDLRHTIRLVMADYGAVQVKRALGEYEAPLQERGPHVRTSYTEYLDFRSHIEAISDGQLKADANEVFFQLFFEGIDVPGYVTMPWDSALVQRMLQEPKRIEYLQQHLAVRLQSLWGEQWAKRFHRSVMALASHFPPSKKSFLSNLSVTTSVP